MDRSRFDLAAALPTLSELGRVHLVAIGGAGMSAVARLLLARGVAVSGSDAQDTRTLAALRDAGAQVAVGHDAARVAGVDTVVVSSAIRETNPELAAARAAGIRVLHRSQALAVVLGDRHRVAVAGANGKTTTTSMLAVLLDAAGADPSFASGGEIAQLDTNARWGAGPDAVVEADESDGTFVVYRPHVAVVTNVQPDHLDFYDTFDNVEQAYAALARSVVAGGLLVACADDAGSLRLADRVRADGGRVLTYGSGEDADVVLGPSEPHGLGTTTRLTDEGASLELVLAVPGRHNVLNAAAAYLAATRGCGISPEVALAGLGSFVGARRRFEVKGEVDGVRVVDDYAHNPAKVAAVVGTAAALLPPGARLHVAFQPHLYSRTRDFAAEFADGLRLADRVVLLDIYGAREEPMPGVSSALVGDVLTGLPGERTVVVGLGFSDAATWLAEEAAPGDLVLTVGAGDVTRLGPLVLAALASRPPAPAGGPA